MFSKTSERRREGWSIKERRNSLRWVVGSTLDSLTKRATREAREVAHTGVEGDYASGQRICTLDIQAHAVFHDTATITPVVYTVWHVRVKYLHSWDNTLPSSHHPESNYVY